MCPYKNLTFGESISVAEPLEYFVVEFGEVSASLKEKENKKPPSSRIEIQADETYFFEIGDDFFTHVSLKLSSSFTVGYLLSELWIQCGN